MMAGESSRGRKSGFSLGTQIFLVTALLVVLAIALAVAVTSLVGSQVGERAARQALERSSRVQLTFQDETFELLRLMAENLASDPNFASYVIESIDSGDRLSILDQLDERRANFEFDFAMLLDPDGVLFCRTDDPEASGQDFSQEALYLDAYENYEALGVWETDGRLFNALAVPVDAAGELVAFLIIAYAIDDGAALELREINNTEVAFLLDGDPPTLTGKTLGPVEAQELLSFLTAEERSMESYAEVELQRQKWLALSRPLEDVGGKPVGAVVHLTSLEVELSPFRRIGSTLLAVGLLTVLLALVASYLLQRRLLQPVNRLAEAAKSASEGDLDQEIAIERSDEVGQLADAFNVLLSELREKRDMEIYVNELARSLPDQEPAASEGSPTEERLLTLVGIELRGYSSPSQGFQPTPAHETLENLSRDLRRVTRSIRAQDGKVEATLGHRLVTSFEGANRSYRALRAAAEVLSNAAGNSLDISAVLVSGTAVTGTTTWDQRPHFTLTGPAVDNLESLLRVAPASSLLLSSPVRDEIGPVLTDSGIELQAHRSTVSELPLYSLDVKLAQRLSGAPQPATGTDRPDLAATHVMPETAQPPTSAPTAEQGPVTLSGVGPGSVLGDRFEILSELGAGGMGVVYKAHDRALGELVALKMLKQDLWGDVERLERLKDELKLARKISHPNVLRTYDFGEAAGYPFISMEFVRGVTLRQVIDRSGRLPLSAGLHTARQLCRGLEAAHAQGVLHRDIKPENLIIEASGNVKLMDFGIARPLQRVGPGKTRAGVIIGTPHYLAPEQLEGKEADERADIYACGIVFYEIFTGVLPYPAGGSLMELITRKMQQPPAPPSQHWLEIPEALEKIILKSLASNPGDRYRDVEAVLHELEGLRA